MLIVPRKCHQTLLDLKIRDPHVLIQNVVAVIQITTNVTLYWSRQEVFYFSLINEAIVIEKIQGI